MMAGFIYIMSNPSYHSGWVKIGKSDRDPEEFRRSELETTGVAHSFKVEYYAYVDDHNNVERDVHSKLQHVRVNKQREFFEVPVPEAILQIRSSARVHFERVYYKSPDEIEQASRKAIARKALEEQHLNEEKNRREKEAHIEKQHAEAKRQADEDAAKRRISYAEAKTSSNGWLNSLFLLLGMLSLLLLAIMFGDGELWVGFGLAGMWGLFYFIREQVKRHYSNEFDQKISMLRPLTDNASPTGRVGNVASQELDPNGPKNWPVGPRNKLCYCGSGRKYKHCHGALN
jgi:hypothetical protein